ncbi:cellulase family glycosylhydrolase [Amycolatopsis sp. WQ 127309]|uniref:glycoside hydrolase 5 family protein n=1 Tax=Amycolatopsis sp. WQ 127309 TaxID=2932773 RepID=UPI001FF4A0A2|nr:cellulase family glycosylhydrolase [Amycolatopsis sp. WQ 127309]UOZ02460.1 cellulase family glycosylhydrolase [Amycolatopsis sp. WQ 127309]
MADLKRRSVLTGAVATALAATAAPALAAPKRRPFRLGVNYTPSTRWFHMWEDWREADLRRDFDDIAALGLDHIRMMLLWPAFQPEPHLVSGEKLDRLHRFLDLAGAAGLDVEVTVFNGHISARYWTPNWLQTTPEPVNWFTDPAALDAQRALLTALAARIGKHPRFLGFDLSNEPYYYWDSFAGLAVTPEQADAWAHTLCETAESVAPGKAHTVGCDRAPWDNGRYFTRAGLADAGNVVAIHPWTSFFGTLKTTPLGAFETHNAERLIQVAQAYATDPARPCWIQEDGAAPSIHFSDATRPQYAEWLSRSIRNAASCAHTLGFTWWCSHDVNPGLVPSLNPLEYDLGLYTNDRRLKPAGRALKTLVAEFDRTPPKPAPRTTAIVIPDADPTRGSDRFFALADAGTRVAFVLQSRAGDASYLAQRGITALVQP